MAKRAKTIVRAEVSKSSLNVDIANGLVSKIYAGETIYPKSGKLEVLLPNGEITIVSTGTINSWITADIVIPSTTKTLREVLDKAREDARSLKRKQLHKVIVDTAETKMGRILKLRTSEVRRNMFGQTMKNEDGSIARKENPALLRTQADMIKFGLERLDPDHYSKVDKSENKHLVFSLADLRREEQRQNEAAQTNSQ